MDGLNGLRQGELCALTWDDIDFENKVMVARKTLISSKDIADFSPHTFAKRCFENGVQLKVIQEFFGHSSMRMTMDLYTHITEEIERNCIGILLTGVKLV